MKILRWILYCAVMLFVACEATETLPLNESNVRLPVIEAFLVNNNLPQRIRVTYSVGLNDTSSVRLVKNAKVYLVESSDTMHFNYSTDGWFVSDTFKAKLNASYLLCVQIEDTVYKATSTLVALHGIDSLVCTYNSHLTKSEKGYYLKMYAGQRMSDSIGYYFANVYKNRTLLTTKSDMLPFKDEYMVSLNSLDYSFRFDKNDTIDVDLFTFSKASFEYFVWLTNNFYGINLTNHSYIENPPFMFSPEALGYFQVSSVSHKQLIVR